MLLHQSNITQPSKIFTYDSIFALTRLIPVGLAIFFELISNTGFGSHSPNQRCEKIFLTTVNTDFVNGEKRRLDSTLGKDAKQLLEIKTAALTELSAARARESQCERNAQDAQSKIQQFLDQVARQSKQGESIDYRQVAQDQVRFEVSIDARGKSEAWERALHRFWGWFSFYQTARSNGMERKTKYVPSEC